MPSPEGSVLYEESQHFGRPIVAMALMTVVAIIVIGAVLIGKQVNRGAEPIPTEVVLRSIVPLILALAAVLLPLLFLIETRVTTRGLYVRLKPFPWRHVQPHEIATHEATTFRPLRDCGGYGVHKNYLTKTTCYNARGKHGVRIQLADGKRLIIGSQTPERLARAITQIRGTHAATEI